MKFSFLVPYRNRDLVRVERCLRSIQHQELTDFEIVFVDYGSDEPMKSQIQHLCGQFPTLHYVYLNTQGWFWSRAAALNEAFRHAKGKYAIVVDIDIMFPPHFLDYYHQHITPTTAYQYQCYYVTEEFKDYENINYTAQHPYKVSEIAGAGGLLVLPIAAVRAIGGFDEYFCVWGMEDIDFKIRLRNSGIQLLPTDFSQVKTFHQWHERLFATPLTASTWQTNVQTYQRTRTQTKVPYLEQAAKVRTADVTPFVNQQKQSATFRFEFPIIKSFTLFSQYFFSLPAGEALSVNQTFEAVSALQTSRLGGIVRGLNNALARFGVSYRITELLTFESELIRFETVRDFLFYFIIENKDFIADYHISTDSPEHLRCFIVKK